MEKLHSKSIYIFFFQFLLKGLFIVIFLSYATIPMMFQREVSINKLFLLPVIIFALYIVFCYIWAKLTYRFWAYEITEDTYKMEQGVIWKRYVSIPYERIQNIDIHRGVIARLLGLSELRIQTAGFGGAQGRWGASTEGKLPGIEREKAEQLREQLISRVKGTKQGL